jgi:hypothetical protein
MPFLPVDAVRAHETTRQLLSELASKAGRLRQADHKEFPYRLHAGPSKMHVDSAGWQINIIYDSDAASRAVAGAWLRDLDDRRLMRATAACVICRAGFTMRQALQALEIKEVSANQTASVAGIGLRG